MRPVDSFIVGVAKAWSFSAHQLVMLVATPLPKATSYAENHHGAMWHIN
jgi:hypothetical protein